MEEKKLRLKIDIKDYGHYDLGLKKKKNTFANEFIEEYIIKELLELQKLADDNGIAILFLKGLIERYDTYLPLDLYRDYGDIDILVSQDDVYDFCALCERLNFKTSNGAINTEWIESNLSNLDRHHLPPLSKSIFGGAYKIRIEIHTVLSAMWNYTDEFGTHTKDIVKRRSKANENIELYGMDIVDRFIFSLLCFSSDFLGPISTYYFCPNNSIFRCKPLVDAYLLLERYSNKFDISLVTNRIREYGFACYSVFALSMLQKLFCMECFEKIVGQLVDECVKMIDSDNLSFVSKVLYNAYLSYVDINPSEEINSYKKMIEKCLNMNKHQLVLKNQYSKLYLTDSNLVKSYVSWNDKDLIVFFEIKKDNIIYWEDGSTDFDCINMRLYNPAFEFEHDNAVRNIFVCLRKDDVIDITFNGAEPTLRGSDFDTGVLASYVRTNDIHQIKISVPWRIQDIKPNEINWVGFECTLRLYDNNGDESFLCWSNNKPPHYNPAKFGKLIFEKHNIFDQET